MPQNSDNTLGAPTEGLGQRVTFAFDPNQGQSQLQLDRGGEGGSGVRGGGTVSPGATQGVGVQAPANPTLDILMNIGGALIKPQLERAKQEAFFNGMQRAMAGEGVADIAKEQPWYSTLFGDSDVVEGARAYASHTVAQTLASSMEDQMPEIRKMDPETVQRFYNDQINQKLTGDRATDVNILQAMTQAMPSIMRRQAKEHYGYMQEQATTAEAAAFKSGAERLQSGAKGLQIGTTTPEEFSQITDQFVKSVIPAAGRDIKNYKQSMTSNLQGWAQAGNFHALNALKDKGFLDVLDPNQQEAVNKAVETGQTAQRAKYSFNWNDDLAKLDATAKYPPTGTTSQDVASQVDVLNDRYQKETGSKLGLITPTERAALVSGSAVTIAREKDKIANSAQVNADKLRLAGDKAAAQAEQVAVAIQRISEGTAGSLSKNPGYSEVVNTQFSLAYQDPRLSPQGKISLLVNNHRENYVNDQVKNVLTGSINAALGSEQYTPQVQQAFGNYFALRQANRFTADAYYEKYAPKLEGFANDINYGLAPEGALRDRFFGPASRAHLDTKDLTKTIDVVNQSYNDVFTPAWMGGQTLQPGQARRVSNEISPYAEEFLHSTGDIKESAMRSLNASKANGLEIMGGYAWQNGKGQTSLADYLTHHVGPAGEKPFGTDADKLNTHVSRAVSELLYGSLDTTGLLSSKASDIYVGRLPDLNGVPQFHIQAVNDGEVHDKVLSANDIYTLSAKRKARFDSVKNAIKTVFSGGASAPAPSGLIEGTD